MSFLYNDTPKYRPGHHRDLIMAGRRDAIDETE